MSDIIAKLTEIIEQRKEASPSESYVANLHSRGLNKILEKVGEEATEMILAAKDCQHASEENKEALIGEIADLWFHSMVLLSHLDLDSKQVLQELENRFNISGLEEKASRKN